MRTMLHSISAGLLLIGPLSAGATAQSVLQVFEGSTALDHFGDSVGSTDDLDGDGLRDWIIGSPRASVAGVQAGLARVYSAADGHVLFESFGQNIYDRFGDFVAGLGDLDGDGVGEFLISTPGHDGMWSNGGRASIYSGADGSLLRTHGGASGGESFGTTAASLGDLDADGVPDYAIAGPGYDAGSVDPGRVVVFSGTDGQVLHTLLGLDESEYGSALACAGDVDGDGVDDLVIGAPGHAGVADETGMARVVSGATGLVLHELFGTSFSGRYGAAVCGVGDLDQDGLADFAVGAPDQNGTTGNVRIYSGADGSLLHFILGSGEARRFGYSLATPGDLDGDGHAELLVGAPIALSGGLQTGSVFIVSGATTQVLHEFEGEEWGDFFGVSIAAGGDPDGDGINEWITGALQGAPGLAGVGAAFVYRGGCLQVQRYCANAPNSQGTRARFETFGVTSLLDNEFSLGVRDAVPGQIGLFFYGDAAIQVPFGDGFRCVGGSLLRLGPPAPIGPAGTLQRQLDFTQPPADALTAGSTRYMQLWYRDPNGPGGSGFNLSDAVEVTFSP